MSEQEDREQDVVHAALRRRADRLVRFLELRAPKTVIGHEIELIVRAGLIYCGDQQRAAFIRWIVGHARQGIGLCPLCSRPLDERATPWCDVCDAEFKAEDQAMEAAR